MCEHVSGSNLFEWTQNNHTVSPTVANAPLPLTSLICCPHFRTQMCVRTVSGHVKALAGIFATVLVVLVDLAVVAVLLPPDFVAVEGQRPSPLQAWPTSVQLHLNLCGL